jgi:hypothetical protein
MTKDRDTAKSIIEKKIDELKNILLIRYSKRVIP